MLVVFGLQNLHYIIFNKNRFSSINESRSMNPSVYTENDRITILAFKKQHIEIKSSTETNQYIEPDYLEN